MIERQRKRIAVKAGTAPRARGLVPLLAALAFLAARPAEACKEHVYPKSLPAAELARFEQIYFVRVETIGERELTARVVLGFKGPLTQGDHFRALIPKADPGCAFSLQKKHEYLLFLRGKSEPFTIPLEDSLALVPSDPHFGQYVADLRRLLAPR